MHLLGLPSALITLPRSRWASTASARPGSSSAGWCWPWRHRRATPRRQRTRIATKDEEDEEDVQADRTRPVEPCSTRPHRLSGYLRQEPPPQSLRRVPAQLRLCPPDLQRTPREVRRRRRRERREGAAACRRREPVAASPLRGAREVSRVGLDVRERLKRAWTCRAVSVPKRPSSRPRFKDRSSPRRDFRSHGSDAHRAGRGATRSRTPRGYLDIAPRSSNPRARRACATASWAWPERLLQVR